MPGRAEENYDKSQLGKPVQEPNRAPSECKVKALHGDQFIRSCFVIERSWIEISAQTLLSPSEDFL
jgi:hypothetical protein